jgi:hypothetical protein
MAQEIARYRFGLVLRHDNPPSLELTWLPRTAAMTDDDWKTGLMLLAAEAEALQTPGILIDATGFGHQFMLFWQLISRRGEPLDHRHPTATGPTG